MQRISPETRRLLGGVACLDFANSVDWASDGTERPAHTDVLTAPEHLVGVSVLGEPLTPAIVAAFVLILGGSVLATRSGLPTPPPVPDTPPVPVAAEATPRPDPGL